MNILKCFKTVRRGGSGQELDPSVLVAHQRAGKGKYTLYGEGAGGGGGAGTFCMITIVVISSCKIKSCTDLNFFSLLLFISFLLPISLHTVKIALIFIS